MGKGRLEHNLVQFYSGIKRLCLKSVNKLAGSADALEYRCVISYDAVVRDKRNYRRARMKGKALLLLIVIGAFLCGGVLSGANVSAPAEGGIAENEGAAGDIGRQLSINERVLFNDPSEQARIDAAMLLLESEGVGERGILIKALGADDSPEARGAVCKALSNSRAESKKIANKGDFVRPLVDILVRQTGEAAKLAEGATLVFDYGEIAGALKEVTQSRTQTVSARVNAIGALQLQPDKRAMIDLIQLLDEDRPEVVEAAEQALQSLGVWVKGKDPDQIKQIKEELKNLPIERFYRGLLIRQEAEIRALQGESAKWKKLYVEALDQTYLGKGDDAARSAFLDTYLGSSEPAARLWALDKVDQWRKGKSTVPEQIGVRLVSLISDPDPQVRLKTATLLSMVGGLDSAQSLLAQLKVEKNEQIKLELFKALGKACYDGLLGTATYRTSAEVRGAALEMAAGYLKGTNPARIREGAKVMGKLLELDGLSDAEVESYLGLLAEVYRVQTEASLRGEILGAMGQLCVQSIHKGQAAVVFGPIFKDSLGDESEVVRQQSLDGLINIDKAAAMVICRQRGFATDASVKIRNSVIVLTEEVGGREDLDWLCEKLGPGPEGDSTWKAMSAILKRSPAEVVNKWVKMLESESIAGRVSDEQMIALLDAAEKISNGTDGGEAEVRGIQEKLATLYAKTGRYEQAAAYWGKLSEGARTSAAKKAYSARLLEVYLKQPNAGAAVQMLNYYVQEGDIGANDVIVRSISGFIAEMPASYDRGVLIGILGRVELPKEARSDWQRQVDSWMAKLGGAGPVVEQPVK